MYTFDFLCGWQVWNFHKLHLGEVEKWKEHQGYILYFEDAGDAVRYFKSNTYPMIPNILYGEW